MDPEFRQRYPTIITTLTSGAEPRDIPTLVGIPAEVWSSIQDDPEFIEMLTGAQPAATAPMSSEQVLNTAVSMTSGAFEALQQVLDNPRSSAQAKIQASKEILAWREELQRKKSEADARVVYHLHLDRRVMTRMQDMINMFMSDEGKAWLQEMSGIMPNSTA